jgi:PAS domain-containing protein
MMWQIDNDGNVLHANQLFLDFLGAKAGDKLNIFDPAVIKPSDYKACCKRFAQAKLEKKPLTATRGLKCHNGKFYSHIGKVFCDLT